MTTIQMLISGAFVIAGFLAAPATAQERGDSGEQQVVYGRCGVEAEGWRDNFGECRLTGTGDGVVPEGKMLVIEHIAAVCTGPVEHQILTLVLGTNLKPEQDMQTQIVIPLNRRELVTQRGSLYQASFRTRLYAGPGTKVEPSMTLETGFLPTSAASCGVMFHGRFVPSK